MNGFDKLETMFQHDAGRNAPTFDYKFNLDCAVAQTARHPPLRQIRVLLDAATTARMTAPPEAWQAGSRRASTSRAALRL
jgi:putative hydrolase of HD superfamily